MKLELYLILKNNPTQLQDQDVRAIRKVLEETADDKPHVIRSGSDFILPKTEAVKEIRVSWTSLKLKTFTASKMTNSVKRHAKKEEECLQVIDLIRNQYLEGIKNLKYVRDTHCYSWAKSENRNLVL